MMYILKEKVNKIALSSNDDKIFQTFDRIKSYPYGSSVGKVCKTVILMITLMKIKQNII